MDVAFYHDEASNRLAAAYDPQSSPGSVDSISSTDAGPVGAIPPYERFGQDYSKASALKVMNVQVHCGNQSFTSEQQVNYRTAAAATEGITVSSENYRQHKSYDDANITNTGCSRVSGSDVVNSVTVSTPDVINMLKITGPDFDQMMTQYSNHAGAQLAPQVYSRGLSHQQEYVQTYARDLARQRSQGGSNPNVAGQNHGATPPPSVITTISNGNFEPTDAFYDVRHHHSDEATNSAFGTLATVHYMGDHPQPGHPLIMPHHSLKDDVPQTVPVIPKQSISPIDMEEQEIIKTERKRMRNRLAASKCRKRKLERISRLEEKVSNLKQQNLELSTNANLLRQQVSELKTKVMSHVNSGCQLMTSQPQVSY